MASWRKGAGRKRKSTNIEEKYLMLKISEDLHCRWIELKNLRKAKEVFGYLS